MNAACLVFLLLLCGTVLPAKQRFERVLTVYLDPDPVVPAFTRMAAQSITTSVFARIGIGLDWRMGRPLKHAEGVIALRFVNACDQALPGDTLAIAFPYEGTRIHLFWDRIAIRSHREALLGHVMAHEIAHLLQGVARHSEHGIMKAHWSGEDHSAMRMNALVFEDTDVDLIRSGLDNRRLHIGSHAAGR